MKTIPEMFENSVMLWPDNVMMWEKRNSAYESTTYTQARECVYDTAAGLLCQHLQKGDRVALLSEARNDWALCELAILYCGAVNVPLSVKLTDPAELKFRLDHSGARFIIVSANQVKNIRPVIDELTVEKVILLDETEKVSNNDINIAALRQQGSNWRKNNNNGLKDIWQSLKGDDYANICYTSGTTADPKGIILTHRNYTANVEQALTLMEIPPWYVSLLILPWDHSFAHTAGIYVLIRSGAAIASVQSGKSAVETIKNIPGNIRETKPVYLLSVPSLAGNFKKNIEKGIADKGKVINALFNHGLQVGYLYNDNGWRRGRGWRFLLKPYYKLFDKIIFKKIRENFGGRLKFFIGGGALLDYDIQRFFYAIGLPMFQGYGLSEASPIISSNALRRHKLGSSGYLVQNLELKICDEDGHTLETGRKGEIVVKGENVMAGYWNNQRATDEALRDGWLHTGDMGYMDKDGFLYVLGRFKSLLIGDDGEKYSPEGIEEALEAHSPLVDQCMLYNNQNPYTVMLLVLNSAQVKQMAASGGAGSVLQKVSEQVAQFRKGGRHQGLFPERWLPVAVALLAEGFTEENKMMNSTLKIVRPKIIECYKKQIEYLYTPQGKSIDNTINREVIRQIISS